MDRATITLELGAHFGQHGLGIAVGAISSSLLLFEHFYNASGDLIVSINERFDAAGPESADGSTRRFGES